MSHRVEIVKRLLDAYNARDWETIRSASAENLTFYDHGVNVGGTTRDGLVRLFQNAVAQCPDDHNVDSSFIEDQNLRVVVSITSYLATHTGTDYLPGWKATGKECGIRACEIWRFNSQDALISYEAYYDRLLPAVELGHVQLPQEAQRGPVPPLRPNVDVQYDT